MNRAHLGLVTVVVLLGASLGCQGGGGNSVLPSSDQGLRESRHAPEASQTHLWGLYDVRIDSPTGEISIVPARGAMFTANVVNFLNGKPDCMSLHINGIDSTADYTDVDIDVTLKHPFPGMSMYDGYDVRGVFMGDGSGVLEHNPDIEYAVFGDDQYMLPDPDDGFGGPDGFTRWFNISEFSEGGMPLLQYIKGNLASPGYSPTATLNPYRYFADGIGKNDDLWTWLGAHPDSNGVFSSGASNTRNYYLRFPSGSGTRFCYAVTADWNGTAPEDHPSNAPEAIALNVTDNSTVYYIDPAVNGGDIKLDLSVWDWTAQLSAGSMEDYRLVVESSVLSTPYVADASDMTPTAGGDHFFTFHVEIPADNVMGVDGNDYWVMVEEANYTYANSFGVPNLAQDDPLCAYFHRDLTVYNEVQGCPVPEPTAITGSPQFNNVIHTATVTSTNLVGATDLEVYLDKNGALDGVYNITGTDIKNVDVPAGTFDATFDLNGVNPGNYFVIVTNSCGETGKSAAPLFVVKEYVQGDVFVSNHPDFDGLPQEGTMAHPYHTILAGANAGGNNKVVLVDYGVGEYPEAFWVNQSNFTLRAYNWYSPSGRPMIGGPNTITTEASIIWFSGSNITLQGFKIAFSECNANSDFRLIFIIFQNNITFKDVYFTGTAHGEWEGDALCADMVGASDITFTNCLLKNMNGSQVTNNNDSIDIRLVNAIQCSNITVEKCEMTELQTADVNANQGAYIEPIVFIQDNGGFNVHNNLIHHVDLDSASSWNTNMVRFILNWGMLSTGTGQGVIANNTIDTASIEDCTGGGASYLWGIDNEVAGWENVDVYNNIVTNLQSLSSQDLYGIQDAGKADYCNIWHTLKGSVEVPWYDPSNEGTDCTYLDPMYVNNGSAPYDYHLDTGSPCIGTGKDGADMGCYGNLDPDEVIGLLGPED